VSERVKELARREADLRARCAAQRVAVADEIANIEARFERIDRALRVARKALLHPAVIVGTVVALFTIGRSGGMKLVGKLYVLSTAARRLVQTIRVFKGLMPRQSTLVRGEQP
jgi:hypothetical protein